MARTAVVSSSVLRKYDRWSAGFYLEDPNLLEDEKRARKQAREALTRLRNARKAIAKNKAKVAQMKKSGEVLPL